MRAGPGKATLPTTSVSSKHGGASTPDAPPVYRFINVASLPVAWRLGWVVFAAATAKLPGRRLPRDLLFRSWAEQETPGPLQLIFSFQRADDPAIPLAKAVTGPHEFTVIINPVTEGYSGKMSNLLHGVEVARHDFLVLSDSDIHARPDTCRQLASLHKQGVDLVSCLMRHVGGGNVWGRIFASFWNFEHMAFIAPAILKQGRDATGGTMAMTRSTLDQMGGLAAFKDYVAEDVAMGRKAHELGFRVDHSPSTPSSTVSSQ